jgi:hypothetical protein
LPLVLLLVLVLFGAPAAAQHNLPPSNNEIPASGGDFGGVGLIETRNARFRPDGTLEAGAALRNQRQFYFVNFQALPFLETTFRFGERLNGTTGHGTTTDRGFDMKFRLWQEGEWMPALAVGLQDLAGTGIYGGEYLVASKRFGLREFGSLDVTAGMGWGRFGTGNDMPNPLGWTNPTFTTRPRSVGQGGVPSWNSWFHGETVGVMGGLEWVAPPIETPWGRFEGLRGKLEYSADRLRDERYKYPSITYGLKGKAQSRVNAGLQWQNHWLDAGLFFVNGTNALFRISFRLNPDRPPEIYRRPPPPLLPRPSPPLPPAARDALLRERLTEQGFDFLGVEIIGSSARVAVSGGRFVTLAQVAGRVARAAQPALPPEVERLTVEWHRVGVPIARLELLRETIEGQAAGSGSAEEILAGATLLPATTSAMPDTPWGPRLDWALEPRTALVLGDPSGKILWQLGAGAGARLELGAGLALAGSVAQTLSGNLDTGAPSNSQLPHVRTDYALYAKQGKSSIPTLYAEGIWTVAPDWFARVTGGILEPMFAGIATEALWRPKDRPVAFGLDLAWVTQRDFQMTFPMRAYNIVTGHASAYLDLPYFNMFTVLRAGRYLAGDWGGTIEIGRRFESGIEVGGWATFTNVPFSKFGEGSFDKGIYIRFPLQMLGPETTRQAATVIRPVQRDGGQRLMVDNPLWSVTREGRWDALSRSFTGLVQ